MPHENYGIHFTDLVEFAVAGECDFEVLCSRGVYSINVFGGPGNRTALVSSSSNESFSRAVDDVISKATEAARPKKSVMRVIDLTVKGSGA